MSSTQTRERVRDGGRGRHPRRLSGTLADLVALVHPDATNREAPHEPPATRGRGPEAFHATGEWLRAAFSDLSWTTEQSIAEGDLVVTYGRMTGRHTGNFVVWTEDAKVERAFARRVRPSGAAGPLPADPGRSRDRALGGSR